MNVTAETADSKNKMSQKVGGHESPILSQSDIYFRRLTRNYTHSHSEISPERFYLLRVRLSLLEQSVRGVLFSLLLRLKTLLP